jgi:hypothetical protein
MADNTITFEAVDRVSRVVDTMKKKLQEFNRSTQVANAKSIEQANTLKHRYVLEDQLAAAQKNRASVSKQFQTQEKARSQYEASIAKAGIEQQKKSAFIKETFYQWELDAIKRQRQAQAAATKKAVAEAKALEKANKEAFRASEKKGRDFRNMMLGIGLTTLFTGMAIKRMADGAFRAISETYKQVMGDSNEFAVTTNILAANWAFLKFSIMDALMQSPLFQAILQWLISVIQWVQGWSQESKAAFGIMILGLSVVGGLMMVLGQGTLWFAANWTAARESIAKASAAIKGLTGLGLMSWLGIIAILSLAVFAIWKLWTTDGDKLRKVLMTVAIALMAIGAVLVIAGVAGGWWIILIGLIVAAVVFFKEEILQLGIIVLTVFNQLIKYSLQPFLSFMQLVLDAIYAAINAWGRWKAMREGTSWTDLKAPQVKMAINEVFDGFQGTLADWNDKLIAAKETRGGFWERLGFGSSEEAQAGLTAPSLGGGAMDKSINIENLTMEVESSGDDFDYQKMYEKIQEESGRWTASTQKG